ncbi:hypothetical protein HKBW3S03_01051 [Candidatus Hakubella thermalkaliphila]|uniref:Uncharacterized protein n=1 Tax=Candidatus Hakubella thermalkaliphila TaxID=2754717 RepID=A0A6V8NM07_9ACTN|nr:hypothetical protein [Candidatus Hakubella thermalkaliphila]GFP19546.1 hypothetical protein HKBW3S03_01051 [Candidatus Hakubella thermalkaliphila]
MEKIVHILTVGTSLLTNTGGKPRPDASYQTKVKCLNDFCDNILRIPRGQDLSSCKHELLQKLRELNLSEEIGYRPPQGGIKDRLPQEISYLWIHKQKHENEPTADCYFLTSDTNTGIVCGEVIKEYVNSHSELQRRYMVVSCEKIKGVDDEKGEDFKQKGSRNLIDRMNEIINQVENEADRIYLNTTGGYKGLVPYSTLQAMVRSDKVVLCYLFENSLDIMEMPVYPIGLDFHLWHRNTTRLRMVLNPRTKEYFECYLDRKIKNLLYEESGQMELFSLGKYLEKQYQNQLRQDPIKVYSKQIIGMLLRDSLGDKVEKLREILEKLVDRVGDLIWEGDKIPEEVDHALNHHHNLLEFAELFLIPILSVDQNYLNVKERFCLLAAILLHDCGHSLAYMETNTFGKVPLFPSEIREFHHFLSCQRLNNPETAKELEWPGKEGLENQGLDENLHDAVLTTCLYHRKSMGYVQKEENSRNHFLDKDYPSLRDYIKDKSFKDIDLMKVVALMRLSDGCDIQVRRAGTEEEIKITLNLLKRDYQTALKRAIDAVELWRSIYQASNDTSKSIFRDADFAIKVTPNKGEITSIKLNDKDRRIHRSCLEKLHNGSSSECVRKLARHWIMTAEMVDRAEMISKQENHYLKHQCVEEVRVIPTDRFNKNNFNFIIQLIENNLVSKYLDKPYSQESEETVRQLIEKEVSNEYESIKDCSYKLSVIYQWGDNEPFYPRNYQ